MAGAPLGDAVAVAGLSMGCAVGAFAAAGGTGVGWQK